MTFRGLISAALVAAVGALAATGEPLVSAQPAAAPAEAPQAAPPTARRGGYLGRERLPDHTLFLPPPPADGSAGAVADLEIIRTTRALANTDRWKLAATDNELGQKALFNDFSCAVGIDLAAAQAPAIARVLGRSAVDLFGLIGDAKERYQRPRPFIVQEIPTCIVPSEGLAKSGSYPSGHAATGWLYALLLAEIDPQNTAAILQRGRAFGESRVVCGVHFPSDLEGGRTTADGLVAALHGNPEFTTDIAAARAELTTLRPGAAHPNAAACTTERNNLKSPW